jgi:hypothetical protein
MALIENEKRGRGWEVAFVLLVFLHIIRISQTSYGLPFRRYLYPFFTIAACAWGNMIHNFMCDGYCCCYCYWYSFETQTKL